MGTDARVQGWRGLDLTDVLSNCRNRAAHISHAAELPSEAYSPWRNTSVEENLKKFEKMRTGQYEEGTAFLRMKGDLMSDNPGTMNPQIVTAFWNPTT